MPLNSSNYSTWKIQCKMALVKDGLWGIISGSETAPMEGADEQAKFSSLPESRRNYNVISVIRWSTFKRDYAEFAKVRLNQSRHKGK